MSEAWKAEPGWLQSPVIRVKAQHSGPGSRKPSPLVPSQGELSSASQATVSEGAAAPLAWTTAEELGHEHEEDSGAQVRGWWGWGLGWD